MAEILYQGHGSFRLTTSGGAVIYVDPFAGDGYDRPADLVYFACDTSRTEAMEKELPGEGLDYAFLPIDGVYNMGPKEASQCAALIEAVHSVPVHMMPGALFDRAAAEEFQAEGRVIVEPGETICW